MRGGGLDTGVGTFILPGKAINGLVVQAKKKAQEMLAERAESAEAEAGEGEGETAPGRCGAGARPKY